MTRLPETQIGDLKITRLICGGNPFSGFSHQSEQASADMRRWYTVERIKQTLRQCEALGITTLVARADHHIMRMLEEYYNEGGTITWIAQTASEMADTAANIRKAAAFGARACYIHGGKADVMMRELGLHGFCDQVRPWLELMAELGMVPGLCTHNPRNLIQWYEAGLPAKFFMACFYDIYSRGEVYLDEDRRAMAEAIRQVELPCLAFKIMAAGRNDPEEAFEFAFSNIKPIDAVVVGFYTEHRPHEIRQAVELTLKYAASAS